MICSPCDVRVRVVHIEDAAPLASLLCANGPHLEPFEPVRPEDFFTAAGQTARLTSQLEEADSSHG